VVAGGGRRCCRHVPIASAEIFSARPRLGYGTRACVRAAAGMTACPARSCIRLPPRRLRHSVVLFIEEVRGLPAECGPRQHRTVNGRAGGRACYLRPAPLAMRKTWLWKRRLDGSASSMFRRGRLREQVRLFKLPPYLHAADVTIDVSDARARSPSTCPTAATNYANHSPQRNWSVSSNAERRRGAQRLFAARTQAHKGGASPVQKSIIFLLSGVFIARIYAA